MNRGSKVAEFSRDVEGWRVDMLKTETKVDRTRRLVNNLFGAFCWSALLSFHWGKNAISAAQSSPSVQNCNNPFINLNIAPLAIVRGLYSRRWEVTDLHLYRITLVISVVDEVITSVGDHYYLSIALKKQSNWLRTEGIRFLIIKCWKSWNLVYYIMTLESYLTTNKHGDTKEF